MNCRRYRLDQVANFRDLGGYACDGGVTRYGVIFRSTALNKATEEDIAKIEHLGVRTVIDLRFPSETKELPDRLGQDMDYINCSLMGTTKLEQLDVVNSSVVETKTLHRMYRLMLRNGGKEIRKALEVVADSEGAVLFHCAAGKDRTGVAAMLILLALGASDETICADFVQTNVCRKAEIDALLAGHAEEIAADPSKRMRFCTQAGVDPGAAPYVLQVIREACGSAEEYLAREYGLTPARRMRLRRMYLE